MTAYLIVKTLHILSSVLLVGTGFGSAFYLYFVNRSRSIPAIVVVSRLVVRADYWFTTPAAIFQPLSGLWLAHHVGWPWTTPWILAALALYALAGVCWLPVVALQLRMRAMAESAHVRNVELPDPYWADAKRWTWLGYPAFIAMLVIYYLMVAKPALAFY